jgi:hypothetical protein
MAVWRLLGAGGELMGGNGGMISLILAVDLVLVVSCHYGRCFLWACFSFDVLAVDVYGELCKKSARGGSDGLRRG